MCKGNPVIWFYNILGIMSGVPLGAISASHDLPLDCTQTKIDVSGGWRWKGITEITHQEFVQVGELKLPSLVGYLYNQSLQQTRASRVCGVIELRLSLRIRPPKLNVDSEETMLSGIARTSRAIADNTGYLLEFVFHQVKISKFSSSLTGCSSK